MRGGERPLPFFSPVRPVGVSCFARLFVLQDSPRAAGGPRDGGVARTNPHLSNPAARAITRGKERDGRTDEIRRLPQNVQLLYKYGRKVVLPVPPFLLSIPFPFLSFFLRQDPSVSLCLPRLLYLLSPFLFPSGQTYGAELSNCTPGFFFHCCLLHAQYTVLVVVHSAQY